MYINLQKLLVTLFSHAHTVSPCVYLSLSRVSIPSLALALSLSRSRPLFLSPSLFLSPLLRPSLSLCRQILCCVCVSRQTGAILKNRSCHTYEHKP